jgi:hypothetical protein
MGGPARPHISTGQSQNRAAELTADVEVPVVTRPLGGGAVWLDESQWCYVLLAPRALAPARPAAWSAWGLAPAMATFRRFGLAVERREQDLWLAGRKIAGSGAATLGGAAVFASSFLLRFPAGRFARCIAAPMLGSGVSTADFHGALAMALAQTMTDWVSHRTLPSAGELLGVFRQEVERLMCWKLADSRLTPPEITARDEALAEIADEANCCAGGRMVANGVKLNAAVRFVARREANRILHELIVDGAATGRPDGREYAGA